MQLHWVDLAIIAIIGLSVVTGLVRGFIKELIALFIWILAIWVAFNYSAGVDVWLQKYLQEPTLRRAAAFLIIMISILIAGSIFNTVLGFIMKRSGLSGTDRVLGMGFGFVRGVFIVALIMVVMKMTSMPTELYANESLLYAKFDPVVNWLNDLMPDVLYKVKTLPHPDAMGKQAGFLDFSASDFELSDG